MYRYLFFFLFFLTGVDSFSQGLLVNGGFEEENTCIEYKVNCAPEAWISNSAGFNNYFKDANRAYSGEHSMAIEAGHSRKRFQRTFIRSQLLCGLRKGAAYRLVFYIKSPHALLDSTGVLFTSIDPLLEKKPLQQLVPSVWLADAGITFSKDSSWQQVSIKYIATGNESFIAFGNFSRRDIVGSTGIPMEDHFFIFLDEISLVAENPNELLCPDWQQARENIYDQNERHEFLQRSLKYRRAKPESLQLTPSVVLIADTVLLPDVLFASSKKELQAASYQVLDSFCQRIKGKTIDSLVIEGHTDNTGTPAFNSQLSVGRAEAVAAYLKSCFHFRNTAVRINGWGSTRPFTSNDTPAGRQENRRVQLFVYFRE